MNIVFQSESTGNAPVQSNLVDHLVMEHFEHVFSLISTFEIDPQESLKHTHQVFHAMAEKSHASTIGLYQEVVRVVRQMVAWSGFLEGVARDSVLCWILKEATPLNYDKIGEVMSMERDEVKHGIAAVRTILISLV